MARQVRRGGVARVGRAVVAVWVARARFLVAGATRRARKVAVVARCVNP